MLAVRLPEELEQRLEALAKATGRTKSYYAREAISAFSMAVDQMQLNPYRNQKRLVQFHYLLTELYRRVGEFGSAEKTLAWLKQTDLNASFIHWTVIEFQDHLISQKDSDHHMMSEI